VFGSRLWFYCSLSLKEKEATKSCELLLFWQYNVCQFVWYYWDSDTQTMNSLRRMKVTRWEDNRRQDMIEREAFSLVAYPEKRSIATGKNHCQCHPLIIRQSMYICNRETRLEHRLIFYLTLWYIYSLRNRIESHFLVIACKVMA